MAKNVQNSHFSFARIFILAESTQLRSSPLHEAAERYASVFRNVQKITISYTTTLSKSEKTPTDSEKTPAISEKIPADSEKKPADSEKKPVKS